MYILKHGIIILLFFSSIHIQAQTDSLKAEILGTETKSVLDQLILFEDVQKIARDIDSFSNHRRKISFLIVSKPDENKPYYHIKAGDNNKFNYITFREYFYYPANDKIKIYDRTENKVYDSEEWIKMHPIKKEE
jgi:hypothetical protein